MDAIQGAGGTHSAMRSLVSVGESSKTGKSADDLPERTPGMGAALSLSREYVGIALREHGFVGTYAASLGATDELGEDEPSGARAGQTDMDARMATEVAAQFGQQVAASSIEAILDIVLRPDPKYVIKLLTQPDPT
jgi:hypothetical protein